MSTPSQANHEIFIVLKQFIGEVIGQEFADELEINADELFYKGPGNGQHRDRSFL